LSIKRKLKPKSGSFEKKQKKFFHKKRGLLLVFGENGKKTIGCFS